jgi:hypothetical protein
MPVGKESKIAMWIHALREYAPTLRVRAAESWGAIRENPAAIWYSPATRYAAIAIGGVIAILIIRVVVGALTPPLPEGAGKPSDTAVFYVICNNETCEKHNRPMAIQRKTKFKRFPVTCPHCNQKTCYRALRETSGPNKGQWVILE